MKLIGMMILLSAATLAAAPADFAGTWKVKYAGPPMTGPKTIGNIVFAITVDANRVTGMAHIGSWPGIAPIATGKVDGDRISFTARGYLSSTTGIPTSLLEGTLTGGDLVIHLSQIKDIGGPGAGGVFEYRGGKLEDSSADAAKIEALNFLSRRRRQFAEYPDPDPPLPLTPEQLALHPALTVTQKGETRALADLVEQWEKAPQAVHGKELDRLLTFYTSPLGQSLVATSPHGDTEVQATVARFVARQ